MKYMLLSLALLFMIGCRSSNSTSVEDKSNETNVILVHGLNSGSTTWKDMVSDISKKLGIKDGSSVEVGMSISIKKGAKCFDAFRENELLDCTDLSEIKGQDIFRKLQATETVFGLDKGKFEVSSISWKSRNLSDDKATETNVDKKNFYAKERVFAINMNNNNQLTYDAQGYQLGKAIDDITKITGVKNYILIGHSMGGLASRAYIQNEKTQNIKKLITLNTPHLGGKTYGTSGLSSYLVGKNAAVNLESDSKALANLNDIDSVAGKYENIDVYHLGYSDGLEGFDFLKRGKYYDESDGIVDIASQMGLDSLEPHQVIFSPILRDDIKKYKNLLTGDIESADEVIESGDYGIEDLDSGFTLPHTMVLSDKAYLDYVLGVIDKT